MINQLPYPLLMHELRKKSKFTTEEGIYDI